ncbi:MAG: TetR/AcrR family transcriptional regulator [Microbacteriaceae bacterium]|nr:TetR/AcrR family transcriptional regulator [Cryobacterium sp.]MCC6376476.1 TetR/AcrR family transcriptional regulator [Microbacteriaceae bacterium]
MSRRAEPGRKAELLEQILDYLVDKPLSRLTFRTVAAALGVSTFTLVYQFGNRAGLVAAIVKQVTSRQEEIEKRLIVGAGSLHNYYENLETSWNWTLDPRNRQLQRLEFEAAMLGVLDPEVGAFSKALYETWLRVGTESLVAFGLDTKEAATQARIAVDTFYGLQYDLLVNGREEETTNSFRTFVKEHRERVEGLVGDLV